MPNTPRTSLYLVPTPIGNLGDITLRAIEILKAVNEILAEDTRTAAKLLQRYDIDKPARSYHSFNEHKQVALLVDRMKQGECFALISEAGTPGISDPGFLVTRACIRENLRVECLPGATAFIPALVCSGIPVDRFAFEGFLPHKKGRQQRLREIASEPRTLIFYESPHRLVTFLRELCDHLGATRLAAASRELSKIHEETLRGTLAELLNHFEGTPPRGEFTIIVEGMS